MPVDKENICVLDHRGGHLRISQHCPHGLLTADFNAVTVVQL